MGTDKRDTSRYTASAEMGVFAARPDQVGAARRFVAGHLSGHPCRSDAELLGSELVTNAISHGYSEDADTVTVTLVATDRVARVSVADCGRRPPCVCQLGVPDEPVDEEIAEHGRGLMLVDQMVLGCGGQWGFQRGSRGTLVWIELQVSEDSRRTAVGGPAPISADESIPHAG